MKFTAATLSIAVAGVSACSGDNYHAHVARQASGATGTISFTLGATNPTAVPLSSIVSNAPAAPTRAVPTPAVAGTKPTYLPNAPALPDINTLKVASYPPLDKLPPTDSVEVQGWIKEVDAALKAAGKTIPTFSPTLPGGCGTNPQALAEQSTRCWWTCNGCVRDTDVANCPNKLTWGLTFDDGPSTYTPDLLAYLDEVKLKATLFVIGSRALSNPAILQASYMAGHQIAVHTWAHGSLTTLSNNEIIAELGWARKVIKDIIGVTPTQMRPPTGDIDDRVRAISLAMGLTPVMWSRVDAQSTFDTDDFNIHSGVSSAPKVLSNWNKIMKEVDTFQTGFIALEHDLFQQSVEIATGYILPDALSRKPAFKIEPVISCLGKPFGASYIETNDNKTNPLPIVSAGPSGTVNGASQSTGGASDASSQYQGVLAAIGAGAAAIFGALAL